MSTLRFNTWQNTGGTEVANSTLGTGKILQVVSTSKTDTFSTSSTSFASITGMSVTITPSSATSKILIFVDAKTGVPLTTNATAQVRLTGGNSGDYIGDTAGSRTRVMSSPELYGTSNYTTLSMGAAIGIYLDSPATTSPVTYQLEMRTDAGTVYLNRNASDADAARYSRAASSITVMEVSA